MRVILQRDWYAPGDLLYLRKHNPHEIADNLLPFLPSGAQMDGKTKRETRKLVLTERHKQDLNRPTPELPQNEDDMVDDEALMAEITGKGKAPPAKQLTKEERAKLDIPDGPVEGRTGKTLPIAQDDDDDTSDEGEVIVHPVNPIPSGGAPAPVLDKSTADKKK